MNAHAQYGLGSQIQKHAGNSSLDSADVFMGKKGVSTDGIVRSNLRGRGNFGLFTVLPQVLPLYSVLQGLGARLGPD